MDEAKAMMIGAVVMELCRKCFTAEFLRDHADGLRAEYYHLGGRMEDEETELMNEIGAALVCFSRAFREGVLDALKARLAEAPAPILQFHDNGKSPVDAADADCRLVASDSEPVA